MRPIAILLTLLLAACGDIPPANYPTEPPPVEGQNELGLGDVFEVVVYNGGQESRASYRVDLSGKISVQHIGEVTALGKRTDELRDEIRSRLADGYLVNPIVSVIVTEVNSLQISVSGEVAKDSKIKFTPGMTIVDAIAQSGGFTPMAKKNHVKVIRIVDGKDVVYKVPVAAIQEGVRPNFFVAPADRVSVPERIW